MMLKTRRDLERGAYYADETRVLRNHVRRMWRGKARRRMLKALRRAVPCFHVRALPPEAVIPFAVRVARCGALDLFEPYPDAHPTLSVGKR